MYYMNCQRQSLVCGNSSRSKDVGTLFKQYEVIKAYLICRIIEFHQKKKLELLTKHLCFVFPAACCT